MSAHLTGARCTVCNGSAVYYEPLEYGGGWDACYHCHARVRVHRRTPDAPAPVVPDSLAHLSARYEPRERRAKGDRMHEIYACVAATWRPVTEIAQYLGMDHRQCVKGVDRLMARGLVERRREVVRGVARLMVRRTEGA